MSVFRVHLYNYLVTEDSQELNNFWVSSGSLVTDSGSTACLRSKSSGSEISAKNSHLAQLRKVRKCKMLSPEKRPRQDQVASSGNEIDCFPVEKRNRCQGALTLLVCVF